MAQSLQKEHDLYKEIYGTWRIVDYAALSETEGDPHIEGTEFKLDKNGDVHWNIPKDAEDMPFFSCDGYCVGKAYVGAKPMNKILLYGCYNSHNVELKAEVDGDNMLLKYDMCCMLTCERVETIDIDVIEFSLISLLEEPIFSDVLIKADNKRKLEAHRLVLQLTAPQVDWSQDKSVLSGMPEPVIRIVLYYLYGESLPPNITEEAAQLCIDKLEKKSEFKEVQDLCRKFIQRTALKAKLLRLLDEACDSFVRMVRMACERSDLQRLSILANPSQLVYTVKVLCQEAIRVAVKLLLLCHLFTTQKERLTRPERHEIIKKARTKIPVVLSETKQLIQTMSANYDELSAVQVTELTEYLAPEVTRAIQTVSQLRQTTSRVIGALTDADDPRDSRPSSASARGGAKQTKQKLATVVKLAVHAKEIKRLQRFKTKLKYTQRSIRQKMDSYQEMSDSDKVGEVFASLRSLFNELPYMVQRIERISDREEESLTWKQWKLIFKIVATRCTWSVQRVIAKDRAQQLCNSIISICRSAEVPPMLQELGLMPTDVDELAASVKSSLNLVEDKQLAQRCLQLFESKHGADVKFIFQESGDLLVDHTRTDSAGQPEVTQLREALPAEPDEPLELRAHSIILAARCTWFRRAFSSGMREALSKEFILHDVNSTLFELLLRYLYGAKLELRDNPADLLTDLLALSDRYEVESLKHQIELTLKNHVNSVSSSLMFLSVADQFSADILKDICFRELFHLDCSLNSVKKNEMFSELSSVLQQEITAQFESWEEAERNAKRQKIAKHAKALVEPKGSSREESDDILGTSQRMQECLAEVKEIVGDEFNDEELKFKIVAADFDVNRTLNYLYGNSMV